MKIIYPLFILLCVGNSLSPQTIIFEDNFSSTTLNSAWTARPNLTGSNGVVDISTANPSSGQYSVRMGKSLDAGGFTTNALDLKLDLANKSQVEMTFSVFDNSDESNLVNGAYIDGIFFSDNNGTTFIKVLDFLPELWCDQYGQFPPLDIGKLAAKANLQLTNQFVIRFQQYDDGDFFNSGTGSDGFYIDNIVVYSRPVTYATLPFSDDFEGSVFSSNWAWRFAEQTSGAATDVSKPSNLVEIRNSVGDNSTNGVRMGKRCDDGFVTNALDLHLNLGNKTQVEMTFKIFDLDDETNPLDGIYFSNDGGTTFKKVFDFLPGSWCDQYGQFPPFDIDQLAAKAGLPFTSQFIIRFQQYDDGDFFNSGTNSDGFYLDEFRVFEPAIAYATLPFSDNFEGSILGNSWAWRFAEQTAGLSAMNVSRPSNLVEVRNNLGFNSTSGVRMGKRCDEVLDGFVTNALDLHLNLANKPQVEMTFRIFDINDEDHAQDGIYFSNDGGLTFKKAFDFLPGSWCDQYGQFPPFDIDELATKVGLTLTDKFIIRFQQHDDGDFFNSGTSSDGFYLDEVNVYVPTVNYLTLPYTENFESGLGNNMAWRFAEKTAVPAMNVSRPSNLVDVGNTTGFNSTNGLRMGKRCDDGLGDFVTNALDIYLNLFGRRGVELSYKIFDNGEETHTQDGIYFSNDGGNSFTKVIDFVYGNIPNGVFTDYKFNVDSLILRYNLSWSNQFIIRLQQHDNGDFFNSSISARGIYIDNINVKANTTNIKEQEINADLTLSPNPENTQIQINYKNTEGGLQRLEVYNATGILALSEQGFSNSNLAVVDVSKLPVGIYFIKVFTTKGLGVMKFVKD
jgi:Secretion system C-terminal sorting domain